MKKNTSREKASQDRGKTKKLIIRTLLSFTAALLAGLLVFSLIERQSSQQEKERMEYIAGSIASETYEILQSQFSKTQVLQAFLVQSGGSFEGFDETAKLLTGDSIVRNVLFAPEGIVEYVYPLVGNESVIGLNMNHEGAGNREAQAAITAHELYMAGPFELIQGGLGIAGRLPVYLDKDGSGRKEYWGIVSVTLDYPAILENSSVKHINDQGFACDIWRISSDTGQKQTILETDIPISEDMTATSYRHTMFNSTWTVSIASLQPLAKRSSFWIGLVICVLVAILTAMVFYSSGRYSQMKQLESERMIENLKRQLELEQSKMLLGQISTHFFYHTLNSLQALIMLKPEDAYEMSGDFARYLRFSIDAVSEEDGIVLFKEELRAVKAYASINEKQLGDRLHMVYSIPEDEDFYIPVLTLQPIVENAILHGIKPKPGGGTISLTYHEEETSRVITIEDDGMGFCESSDSDKDSENKVIETPETVKRQSVGLANVRKRLSHFEGCQMTIKSEEGKGTIVTIKYSKNITKGV